MKTFLWTTSGTYKLRIDLYVFVFVMLIAITYRLVSIYFNRVSRDLDQDRIGIKLQHILSIPTCPGTPVTDPKYHKIERFQRELSKTAELNLQSFWNALTKELFLESL